MILMEYCSSALHLQKSCSTPWSDSQRQCNCWNTLPKPCRVCNSAAKPFNTSCKMIKGLHHSVEGLHQTRSSNLTTSTLGAPKSGIYPKCTFPPFQRDVGFAGLFWDSITLEQVRTVLFMTSDGCCITWFSWNSVALDSTCRSLVQTMVRLTEAMQLLKHLAEALQSLQFCCQTIQYQLWIQNAQRLTSFSWRLASNLIFELDNLDIGCTQVWNLSQMHLSTFPKGCGLCWIVLGPHYVGASEKCSLHDVWWLLHTLDRCRELFHHMSRKMDTPQDDSHGIL